MRILLAGGSGLIGRLLVPLLAAHDTTLIGRRATGGNPRELTGAVEDWPALIAGSAFDLAISTLGTTIRQAGSQAAFAAIDRDAVLAVARAAHASGARHFIAVTSVGASASATNFYLKTKGEAEAGLKSLGFDRLDLIRPGLLRGKRAGPSRPGESIAMAISPITDLLTPAVLDQYRSIAAVDVARAIVALAGASGHGTHVHQNREILGHSGKI